MKYLIGVLGIALCLFLAWLISSDKKKIKIKPIIIMLVLQFIFAFALLNTTIGETIILGISHGVNFLFAAADEGINFVFGGLTNKGVSSQFFLNVLMPMIFISALVGILKYLKILPLIINGVGFLLGKINGMGKLESYNAVAYPFLSSGVFVSYKDKIPTMSDARLFAVCLASMSTVTVTVVGSYMQMLKPVYVVIALVMNLIGTFIISLITSPYEVAPADDVFTTDSEEENSSFFAVIGDYMTIGFNIAVSVAVMVVGFVGLIAFINAIFSAVFGISFQGILGYVFAPFAFMMGVPWEDAIKAGGVMATKIISNEFVAIQSFQEIAKNVSARTEAIISVFILSFANFGTLGLTVGVIGGLDKNKGAVVAKFGMRMLLAAVLVSMLNATIVGLVF